MTDKSQANANVKVEMKPKLKAKAPARNKAKMRVVMQRYYKPSEDDFNGQLDGLGRLPKGQMVEVQKKLGEQLIANGIAVVANA